MDYVIGYLFCGVAFNAVFDVLVTLLGEEHTNLRLTFGERIIAMLLWPIGLFSLIKHFINDTLY